jgi:hypothetical protein
MRPWVEALLGRKQPAEAFAHRYAFPLFTPSAPLDGVFERLHP